MVDKYNFLFIHHHKSIKDQRFIQSPLIVNHTVRRFYFATAEVRFMFSSSFRKLGLAFNLEYLCQFFINFNNQCQFWNPHDEQITNLSLIFKFNEEIMEKIGNEEDETKLILESWKACFYQHRSSFTHRTGKQTSLSNHIWKLRDQDLDYRLTWGVLGHARPYNPVTGLCST